MADGFQIMAVGIEDEGAEIIGMIVPANAGRAVIAAAGRQRRGVEGAHRLLRVGGEGEMDRPGRRAERLARSRMAHRLSFSTHCVPCIEHRI